MTQILMSRTIGWSTTPPGSNHTRWTARKICSHRSCVLVASLLCGGLLLTGCGNSPLSRYPDFLVGAKEFRPAIVLCDVSIVDALLGDTDRVDVAANRRTGQACVNYLTGKLNECGIAVDRSLLTSVGLLMDPRKVYDVKRVPGERGLEVDTLSLGPPPFSLNRLFALDAIKRELLTRMYRSVLGYEKRRGDAPTKIDDAINLGQSVGGGMLVILIVSGYNIPVTIRDAKDRESTSLLYRKVATGVETQLSIFLYIVDSRTGEIVWDDSHRQHGGVVHDEKILEMIDGLIDHFPRRSD